MNSLTPRLVAAARPVHGPASPRRHRREHATLIVDAGNSPRHARLLLDEVARLPIPSPTYLALTHWHWDHVFGASACLFPPSPPRKPGAWWRDGNLGLER